MEVIESTNINYPNIPNNPDSCEYRVSQTPSKKEICFTVDAIERKVTFLHFLTFSFEFVSGVRIKIK